jgi:hypothetical protein
MPSPILRPSTRGNASFSDAPYLAPSPAPFSKLSEPKWAAIPAPGAATTRSRPVSECVSWCASSSTGKRECFTGKPAAYSRMWSMIRYLRASIWRLRLRSHPRE